MTHKDYPYLYETHMHTCLGSKCAKATGREMALAAKEAGYTGIIVTDHSWYGNTAVPRELPWKEWVENYCKGYEEAKACGEEIGLDVFFGYESNYSGAEFLVYGVDKQWLMDHPGIKNASVKEQLRLIHKAGGIVIQAHPFREESYIPQVVLYPEDVDGVEGINATHSNSCSVSHNDPVFDEKAIAYANAYGHPMTAGSDAHNTHMFWGGMAFRRKLASIEDFCRAVLDGEDYLLTNGDVWFDRKGRKLSDISE